jgi:hypothetical protein
MALAQGAERATQTAPRVSSRAQGAREARRNTLQVYLVTVGQGSAVWEKFGHNALWFRDPAAGIDLAYNWGTFDFNQPRFLQRFLTGDTRYWVEGYPGELLFDFYRSADRTIVLQQLNLTEAQARRAFQYAQWNAREENKFYRYDYYRDNCSTRVRDVIDLALGGQLLRALQDTVPLTFHSETARLVDDLELTQLGISAALGRPADRRITVWESAFIPMRLRDAIRGVRVRGPGQADSTAIPLVVSEQTLYESRSFRERADAPSLWLPYLILGVIMGGQLAAFAWLGAARRSSGARRVFLVQSTLWAVLCGIGGLVLLLAWTSTRHVFWYRNENLLLLNPISLWLALLVPLSAARSRFRRSAGVLAVVVALIAALALIAKALPGSQQNAALALLVLPIHFAVAYGLRERASGASSNGILDRR